MPTLHLLITGKVQGVFYRATAKQVATKSGITGWIKNTEEGNVEAMVSGTEGQLQAFVEWCKNGPRLAKVSQVVVNEVPEKIFVDFSIER